MSVTESRAVRTMTGSFEPWERSWFEHLEAVHAGHADVEHHQVELAAEGVVQPHPPVGHGGGAVAVGRKSLRDEGRDALLVLDDQDAGHRLNSSSSVSS